MTAPLASGYSRNSKSLLLPLPSSQTRSEVCSVQPESYRPLLGPQLHSESPKQVPKWLVHLHAPFGGKKCWNLARSTFWLKEHKAKQIPEMASTMPASRAHMCVCRQTSVPEQIRPATQLTLMTSDDQHASPLCVSEMSFISMERRTNKKHKGIFEVYWDEVLG